ncbi:A24 family peptidase [Xanthobacter oligotrophicus]|uniref:A24 family peptidase n=1 Tax=Xanthobacter oligotrophicus TaxID=2607286 RepID=A0ABW7A2N8_9HYPH
MIVIPLLPLLAARSRARLRLVGIALVCIGFMGTAIVIAPTARGLLAAGFMPVLAAIALVDGQHFIIPDGLSATGLLLGLAYATASDNDAAEGLLAALLCGGTTALLFLALRASYRALRGREGLGLGDVKLAGVAGLWLSPLAIALAVEIAALSGLLAYGVAALLAGRVPHAAARLPFGLFFAPAIAIALILDFWLSGADMSLVHALPGAPP